MAIKKAIYKVDNGSGFDEIMFKTTADQVHLSQQMDITLEEKLVEIDNHIIKSPKYQSQEFVGTGTMSMGMEIDIPEGKIVNFDINFTQFILSGNPRVNLLVEKVTVFKKDDSYYLSKHTTTGNSITTISYDSSTSQLIVNLTISEDGNSKLDIILYS